MQRPVKLKRKEFIKLSILGSAGIYFNACGDSSKNNQKIVDFDSLPKDSFIINKPPVQAQPTFALYKKGDAAYETLRKGFNRRINKFPAAIAKCRDTEEVAQAVKYGIENKLQICVKSGGHSFEGFSTNNDGLVIDVSAIKQITWLQDNLIKVGPGCTLSELYDAILPKKKLLPAGSCGGVGLGGLTLGGGYGLFSRELGLTCDSMYELTMVDGNGHVVHSKNDNSLLWACRGGGNGNFGVITSMTFALTPAPEYLQSFRFKCRIEDENIAVSILEKWFRIAESLPLPCFSAFVLNGKSLYILLTTTSDNPNSIEKIITQLSAITDKTIKGNPRPIANAVKVYYGVSDSIYFKNASAGFYKNFEDIKECILPVIRKVMDTPGMIYQVNTLGGKINHPEFAKASAFPHRDKRFLSELQTYWQTPAQTYRMEKSFEEVQQLFYSNGIRDHYRNYPDINFKNFPGVYYDENYSRLQKLKQKYDPGNNFRYEQSITL